MKISLVIILLLLLTGCNQMKIKKGNTVEVEYTGTLED